MNGNILSRIGASTHVLWVWIGLLLCCPVSQSQAQPAVQIMGENFPTEKSILYRTLKRRGYKVKAKATTSTERLQIYLLQNSRVKMRYGSETQTYHLPSSLSSPNSRCRAIVALVDVFIGRAKQRRKQKRELERQRIKRKRQKRERNVRIQRRRRSRRLERKNRQSRFRRRRKRRRKRIAYKPRRRSEKKTNARTKLRAKTPSQPVKERLFRKSIVQEPRQSKPLRKGQKRNILSTRKRTVTLRKTSQEKEASRQRKELKVTKEPQQWNATRLQSSQRKNPRQKPEKARAKKETLSQVKQKPAREKQSIQPKKQRLTLAKIGRLKTASKRASTKKPFVFLDIGLDGGFAAGQLSILTGGGGVSMALRLWDVSILLEAGVHSFVLSEAQGSESRATYRIGLSGGWRTPLHKTLKQTDIYIFAGIHLLPMMVEQQQGSRQIPQVGISLSSQFEWHFFHRPNWRVFKRWSFYLRTGLAGLILRYEPDSDGLDRRAYPSPWQFFLLSGIQVRL